MALDRSVSSGNFALDIDSFNVGYLKEVSGMNMEAEIVDHKNGPDIYSKKNVATVKWGEGKAKIGIGMGKGMYEWIKLAFDKAIVRKGGTLVAGDFNHKAVTELTFTDALITSVTVPKLDGSSKESAYFDISWQPETVVQKKGGGEDIRAKLGPKQKAWLTSNFRFELGGLPCNRVSSIDSFTWKCGVTPDAIGIHRLPQYVPTAVTVPDLKVTISYADHQAWADAAKKWFVDGNHLEGDEMTGRIVFLGPDMKKELGEITLENVGFKSFAGSTNAGGAEAVKRFDVTLYVEKMAFKLNESDA